jgi:hypothetical protein|tara:strand:- start:874 stop:1170 length:297 start_codon:yes stop_codon:yes gene_type:complete
MARRKTMNVEDIKNYANHQLSTSIRYERKKDSLENIDAEYRKGVMAMIEAVLFETDNYKGYRYLAVDEIPTGCTPGIRRNRGEEKQFENTDNTRVRYF